jgi:hypothetical protein
MRCLQLSNRSQGGEDPSTVAQGTTVFATLSYRLWGPEEPANKLHEIPGRILRRKKSKVRTVKVVQRVPVKIDLDGPLRL